MSAVEVPVRVRFEESFVAAPDHFGKCGSVAVRTGAPYLDDGIRGQGQVNVEEVLFPYGRGQ